MSRSDEAAAAAGAIDPAPRAAAGAATPDRRRPPLSLAAAAWALALLMGLQPVTTDLYLPALPLLTRELAAPMAGAQLTMAALILAFGLGQMVWGPVADRCGRRPVLLVGLALYVAAGIACALAQHIDALIVARALQGAALAAAVVCARAIVRDLYEPLQGAQVMARALTGLGFIALASPLIGGLVTAAAGWRAALVAVALVGAVALVHVWRRVPETLAVRNTQALAPLPLLRTWAAIAREPVFRAWALLVACTYGGLFTVLASASFVFIDLLGLGAAACGAVMAIGSACYIAGTFACRRWIPRHGLAGTVRRGAVFSFTGGALIVVVATSGAVTWWNVLLAYGCFAFGHGLHQPCGQAGVVAPFPRHAGAASALAGLLLALVAFGVGRFLGATLGSSIAPLATSLGFWALATTLVACTLVQRHALPAHAAAR
jgi:DHA1 family bicyclomycin/chloramphenicol resistance-like MFS transporter